MTSPVFRLRCTLHGLPLKPVAFALACMGLPPSFAQVLPTGATLRAGSATVGAPTALANGGLSLGISQASGRAVLDWQTFSIGALDRVNVVQPGTSSVLLNRVTGAQASGIAGRLTSTLAANPAATGGSVYLINPNGVTFSAGSSVSVGGLVASTLNIVDDANFSSFMAGGAVQASGAKRLSFASAVGSKAAVANEQGSSLQAADGGIVALVGAVVRNEGSINVARGNASLVSAQKVSVDFDGDGLTTFRVDAGSLASTALVENTATGQVIADGGQIMLLASSATSLQQVVNQRGLLRARTMENSNGQIVLGGTGSNVANGVAVGGTIDVTGTGSGGARGGSIVVTGDRVTVTGEASLDASGSSGGGAVSLGGRSLNVQAGSRLRADATGSGNGGQIALVSSQPGETLDFAGTVSAVGAGSGRGGTVQTSAYQLSVANAAGVDAAGGTGGNGTWQISSGTDLRVVALDVVPGAGQTSIVLAQAVGQALSHGTDVTLASAATADHDSAGYGISFDSGAKVTKDVGGNAMLRVDSKRGIFMDAGSAIQSGAGALDVNFNADSAGSALSASPPIGSRFGLGQRLGEISLTGATIETHGGNIRFYGQSDPVNGTAYGGSVASARADSSAVGGAAIDISGSTLSTCAAGSSVGCTGAGLISLRGQGETIDLNGSSTLRSATGVLIAGSTLETGTGAIGIAGRGGIGSDGVAITIHDDGESTRGSITTAGGDVRIAGTVRSWVAGNPVDAYFRLRDEGEGLGAGSGVIVQGATLTGGGNVSITGQGGDLGALGADPGFRKRVSSVNNGTGESFAAGVGVTVSSSAVSAGRGSELSLTGTAGGRGFTIDGNGALTPAAADIFSVGVLGSAGKGLSVESGTLVLDGGAGDVGVVYQGPAGGGPGGTPTALLSTASDAGAGGTIDVRGRNVVVNGGRSAARIDSSGVGQAGSVRIEALGLAGVATGGVVAVGESTLLEANALSATGNGGDIHVIGRNGARIYGAISARGGSEGGNGGFVETSAPAFDIAGVRINAAAPAGAAGTWLIDPYDVTIVHRAAAGSLPTNPFVPIAAATLQDGDINAALDGGANVTVTTGTGGPRTAGSIALDTGVLIDYSAIGGGARTFRLDANYQISDSDDGTGIIRSSAGADPLNVVFNASGTGSGSNFIGWFGRIETNGGDLTMLSGNTAQVGDLTLNGNRMLTNGGNVTLRTTGPTEGGVIGLYSTAIDTRVGSGNAGLGGAVLVDGGSVLLRASVSTSTGDVSVTSGQVGYGVEISGSQNGIFTTSGNVKVEGRGRIYSSSSGTIGAAGVTIRDGSTIRTGSGDIAVHGYGFGTRTAFGPGVVIEHGSQVTTLGGGDIEITGTSENGSAGLALVRGFDANGGPGATPGITGSGKVMLRAFNDGTGDAIALQGPVGAAGVLDLRPGSFDVTATLADATTAPITLGGTVATGFALSAAELALLDAPTVVIGSNRQAGNIDVVGAVVMGAALTLQNQAGSGHIDIAAPLSTPQLALLAGGNIAQARGAAITADTLLARSDNGSVLLPEPTNKVTTVAGSAASRFDYVDADALTIGPVTATTFDAVSNAPATDTATSMAASNVFVRNLTGDLSLAGNVGSTAGADLVTAGRLQNTGGNTLGGATWRVWADTWLGETRGGLAGSGPLPNFFSCVYSGLCGVTVTPGASHFIYRQQPDATVVVANASRATSEANPAFSYTLTGLILGDTGAGFSGATTTTATADSGPGLYPINGNFRSAEGYRVLVQPGTLAVTLAPAIPPVIPPDVPPVIRPTQPRFNRVPLVDVVRELPTTYLYDRNIGQAPMCFATGPLEGDRTQQGGDVLAREWSRVRSRPKLTSCVDTEKRNGCSDF